MMPKKRGRPLGSRTVKVTPEFRENPDIKKMGLVFMAAAKRFMELEREERAAQELSQTPITATDSEGDGVI